MVSLVIFIVVGLLVTIVAKALMPGRDPGIGMTLVLGMTAQILAWFSLRLIGFARYGQPWQFFVSIGVAAFLLYAYRDVGFDEILARRAERAASEAAAKPPDPPPEHSQSLLVRIALTPVWAAAGAIMLGLTGFVIGFFGPMRFHAGSNQGPMLGIFITGPGGVLLGGLIGGALKISRPDWPARWRIWALNVANIVYGLCIFDMVADPFWWR
jgi:uncharacterized membrane protein YeaQ/YmgE (transglycosylase-associated protein family)